MTKYLDKSFSSKPSSQAYRDNWEQTFRGEPQCGFLYPGSEGGACELEEGHAGYHEQKLDRFARPARWRDNGEILC